jgi:hypothetical protein
MASSSVSVSKLPISEPSLCIPRVFPNITWKRVKDALEDVGLGEIDRVDMVNKTNDKGEKFKRVFVHFKKWATTPEATAAREMVMAGDMFEITYDDPWFWKIGKSHAKKPERRTQKKAAPKKTTRPKLSIRTPKNTAPSATDIELARVRAAMEQQRRELEDLRAQMAASAGASTTPCYAPVSPAYVPTSLGGTPPGSPPVLKRYDGTDDVLLGDTPDHIAREAEEEIGGGAAAC